jgi:hypothetical protein
MRLKKGGFTIFEEDPTIYPHIHACPMKYIGTVIVEWAARCFRWVNMRSTIKTIKEVVPYFFRLENNTLL